MTPDSVSTRLVCRSGVVLAADGPSVTASITGDVDSVVADELRALFRRCLRDQVATKFVVDLDDVSTFGSAGLRVLTQLRSSCRRRNIVFEIRHPSATSARVLHMFGFSDVVSVLASH